MALVGAGRRLVHLLTGLLGIVEHPLDDGGHLTLGETLHVVLMCSTGLRAHIVGRQALGQPAEFGIDHALGSIEGGKTRILHVDILAHTHTGEVLVAVVVILGARKLHFFVAHGFGGQVLARFATRQGQHGDGSRQKDNSCFHNTIMFGFLFLYFLLMSPTAAPKVVGSQLI